MKPIGLAILAVLAASGIAAAEDKCTCRAQDRNIEVGKTVCLRTAGGYRLATCGLVQNNTSWTISQTPCLSSRIESPDGTAPDLAPAPQPG